MTKKISVEDIVRATKRLPEELILSRPLKHHVRNRKSAVRTPGGIKNRRRRRYI